VSNLHASDFPHLDLPGKRVCSVFAPVPQTSALLLLLDATLSFRRPRLFARQTEGMAVAPARQMTTLGQLMGKSPLTVEACSSAQDANDLANRRGVHHVLVTQGPTLVGLACVCDLANALDRETVSHHMKGPPVALNVDDSPHEAARLMQSSGESCFPVADAQGRLSGVVTRSDLRESGYLPNERGVDVCAACGTAHHLSPRCCEEPVFCSECLEQVDRSGVRQMYFTLGGGD
jgi:CBS domain-containing protein